MSKSVPPHGGKLISKLLKGNGLNYISIGEKIVSIVHSKHFLLEKACSDRFSQLPR